MRISVVGDSFAEGLGDNRPDGTPRGWADRVAEGLAGYLDEPVFYTNFAIRGRLLEPIATGQLEAALALKPKPDLILFNGGGNDMMRQGFSIEHLMELTRGVIARCREEGVQLVLISGANPSDHLPFGSIMRDRGAAYLVAVRKAAADEQVRFISNWEDTETQDRRYWADDRLHLGPLGHARVASVVLSGLGFATPAPDPGEPVAARTLRSEVRYGGRYLLPWVGRRIIRRSSGDGRVPKQPNWTLVHPA